MLVFIDESGDTGLKVGQGSSEYFAVALVVFNDHDDAVACDQRIELLRHELGWPKGAASEFHFARNSARVRKAFFEAVAPYNFFYYVFAINKDPAKLWGPGFRDKVSFYKYTCSLVFENAKDKLQDAIVLIDKSGSDGFRRQLDHYLRAKMRDADGSSRIKKVKMQRSTSNNLLQLADYVVGAVTRSLAKSKANDVEYRKLIAHREIEVRAWPQFD